MIMASLSQTCDNTRADGTASQSSTEEQRFKLTSVRYWVPMCAGVDVKEVVTARTSVCLCYSYKIADTYFYKIK